MGDEATIREIISEVDTDNVSYFEYKSLNTIFKIILHHKLIVIRFNKKPINIGRKDKLWWILHYDEEWNTAAYQYHLVFANDGVFTLSVKGFQNYEVFAFSVFYFVFFFLLYFWLNIQIWRKKRWKWNHGSLEIFEGWFLICKCSVCAYLISWSSHLSCCFLFLLKHLYL